MVYRTSDFKFPPSRGRDGFEVKKGGEFILYFIGRDDRPKKNSGHFKVEYSNILHIYFDEEQLKPFSLQILTCNDNILRVERK